MTEQSGPAESGLGGAPQDSDETGRSHPDGCRVSPFDMKVYRRAGIPEPTIAAWVSAGIAPYQAEGLTITGRNQGVAGPRINSVADPYARRPRG